MVAKDFVTRQKTFELAKQKRLEVRCGWAADGKSLLRLLLPEFLQNGSFSDFYFRAAGFFFADFVTGRFSFNDLCLEFPIAVILNAVVRRNTQMSAKERKRKSAKERKRAQKGEKERFRVKFANNQV